MAHPPGIVRLSTKSRSSAGYMLSEPKEAAPSQHSRGRLGIGSMPSLDRRSMTAICAFETFEATSRVDVQQTYGTAASDASVGRKAALGGAFRKDRSPRHSRRSTASAFTAQAEVGHAMR